VLKVVYVSAGHLTDVFASGWCLDALVERGADVEYWDVVDLVRPPYIERWERQADYVRKVRTFGDLKALIKSNRDARFVIVMTYEPATLPVLRLLSRYRVKTFLFSWGTVPPSLMPRASRIYWRIVADPIGTLRLAAFRAKLKAYLATGLIRPFDVVFAAGAASEHVYPARRVVPIAFPDCEDYEASRSLPPPVEGRYAVFIGQNLPEHTDGTMAGWPQADTEGYYAALDRFFTLIEREHGLKVVIAAHPRSDHPPDRFAGRPIIQGKTAALVRHSSLVIAHYSLAISYAVLACKPILFIYTSEMFRRFHDQQVKIVWVYAQQLGQAAHAIELVHAPGQIVLPTPDLERYKAFIYNYLVAPGAGSVPTKDIVVRELTGA
jgi:hypothetical protein